MPDSNERPVISIIAAMAENRVIGKDGQLPWRLPDEMKHFIRLTTGHTLIMGRKTFESIGSKPLPNRRHIILTSNRGLASEAIEVAPGLDKAIELLEPGEEAFISGGERAYRDALPLADNLYLTTVHCSPEGDAHFPEFDPDDWQLQDQVRHEADERHAHAFTFHHYRRLR
tara:strand:- start:1188 stop:1700 length:513 start_codon:yes stop_codon:yes gene_type:complete